MSEMIDRVARAMAANDSGPEGSTLFAFHWREFGEGYVRNARAAIEAMREPTQKMSVSGVGGDPEEDAQTYRQMIEAALKEPKT